MDAISLPQHPPLPQRHPKQTILFLQTKEQTNLGIRTHTIESNYSIVLQRRLGRNPIQTPHDMETNDAQDGHTPQKPRTPRKQILFRSSDTGTKPPHPSTFNKLVKPYAFFDSNNFRGALILHPLFSKELADLELNHLDKHKHRL